MTSRESRFWLTFESGAREGDRVPLALGVQTVGRRPDNDIPVSHGSVSGRHAELRVGSDSVTVVDKGSTNGTRVGTSRVTEVELAHGDFLSFGSVKARFEDAEIAAAAPSDAFAGAGDDIVLEGDDDDEPLGAPPIPAAAIGSPKKAGAGTTPLAATPRAATTSSADALTSVSAETLAKSGGSRGVLLPILLVLLLGAAGFAVWRYLPRGEEGDPTQAVPEIPGNLLANASFEDPEAGSWNDAEEAPQSFFVDRTFANLGSVGFGAVLEDGEWAFARSDTFTVPTRGSITLAASLSAADAAVGRVGLELTSRDGSAPPILAWAAGRRNTGGFADVELGFDALAGYDRAAVVVAALADGGPGDVSLDDVSVLTDPGTVGPAATFEEYALYVLGDGGSTAILARSGRVLFRDISLSRWTEDGLSGFATASWSVNPTETGFALRASAPAPAGTRLSLRTATDLALAAGKGDSLSIATTGPDGYEAHPTTFSRAGATGLLAGGGNNMIRFGFAQADVSSRYVDENASIRVDFGGQSDLELQLTFRAERTEAERLARDARDAERAEEYGRALATWSQLVDGYPFEAELLAEAEESRSRLSALGHERIEAVTAELERARFFHLSDIFAQCRRSAREVAAAFRGSETEAQAQALVAEIDAAVAALSQGAASEETTLLDEVLSAIDPSEAPQLRAHVEATRNRITSDDPQD